MSQKDYTFKIVEQLLKKENHIRGLAKILKTNQTTIARKIKELEKENIVDFNQEGKNMVCFLKKTLEAQEFVYIVEHNKLLEFMEEYPIIKKLVGSIKKERIKLAVLFGSYARRQETKTSDIDIYIETQDKNLKNRLEQINSKLSIKIGMYNKENLLIKEIEKDHVIIKGVEEFYEKAKFFN